MLHTTLLLSEGHMKHFFCGFVENCTAFDAFPCRKALAPDDGKASLVPHFFGGNVVKATWPKGRQKPSNIIYFYFLKLLEIRIFMPLSRVRSEVGICSLFFFFF